MLGITPHPSFLLSLSHTLVKCPYIHPTRYSYCRMQEGDKPTQTERKHVYDVYDKIAPHFSHTRYKPWPRVQHFLNGLKKGAIVCDVGCGNGKYLGVNAQLHMVGTDRSLGLLHTAQQKSLLYELFAADSLNLPLRTNSCDAFISIAVIHHLSTPQLRERAVKELARVLKSKGEGLIYVWAFEQELQESVSKRKFKEQDVMVSWHLPFKFEGDLEEGAQIDHQKKTVVYQRYYHVFKQGQLQSIVQTVPSLKIVQSYYDKENWCCRVIKQ